MASKKQTNIAMVAIVILAGAAFGYTTLKGTAQSNNSNTAKSGETTPTSTDKPAEKPKTLDKTALIPNKEDMHTGDKNAPVTMFEFVSLSCNHCAHYFEKILPDLQKNYIEPGKLQVVVRHFPHNDPALKAAMLVECAGKNGLSRENYMKVLYDMQAQWAFSEDYLNNLKQIAKVGGLDSAAFDSCMADKTLETKILATRQEAEKKLGIEGVPAFFINGERYEGGLSTETMSKSIDEALAKH